VQELPIEYNCINLEGEGSVYLYIIIFRLWGLFCSFVRACVRAPANENGLDWINPMNQVIESAKKILNFIDIDHIESVSYTSS